MVRILSLIFLLAVVLEVTVINVDHLFHLTVKR